MNPSTTQARVVVDELVRGGVRDVVLCPGSRNAPLAFALKDADDEGRLRLHVRIDERTAGFLAIGLAVAAGAPVCVTMTSGTAVANIGPAVVEANYARVPLIVLSANRPYEMLGTGASQTMEQLGYFGTQVRRVGQPRPRRRCARATRRAQRAVALGDVPSHRGRQGFSHRERRPGAVRHPAARATGARRRRTGWRRFPQGRPDGRPWTYTPPVTFDQPLEIDLTRTPSSSRGTARVCTPTSPTSRRSPSRRRRPPVNPLHPLALPLLRPQQVIMLGRPTLHRPVSRIAGRSTVPVYRPHHRPALARRFG